MGPTGYRIRDMEGGGLALSTEIHCGRYGDDGLDDTFPTSTKCVFGANFVLLVFLLQRQKSAQAGVEPSFTKRKPGGADH